MRRMKKEVVITFMLLSLVMPWFKGAAHSSALKPPAGAAQAAFCTVSATECSHGNACPVHGDHQHAKRDLGHAGHAGHDKYTTPKNGKNKGHCAHYIHCGADASAELPGVFSVRPFLTGSLSFDGYFSESPLFAPAVSIWSDANLSIPERPPAFA